MNMYQVFEQEEIDGFVKEIEADVHIEQDAQEDLRLNEYSDLEEALSEFERRCPLVNRRIHVCIRKSGGRIDRGMTFRFSYDEDRRFFSLFGYDPGWESIDTPQQGSEFIRRRWEGLEGYK